MNNSFTKEQSSYVARRRDLFYYQYVDLLVRVLAEDAKSLIDVGAHKTSIIENFDWIPERSTLDIVDPYSSAKVRAIKANFFDWQAERLYDFALCLQVIEHIEDAGLFTRKLFKVSQHVLISLPYLWPAGSDPAHIHDPVDERKMLRWASRPPTYSIIVNEVFSGGRIIAYYHPDPGSKDELTFLHKAKMRMRALRQA